MRFNVGQPLPLPGAAVFFERSRFLADEVIGSLDGFNCLPFPDALLEQSRYLWFMLTAAQVDRIIEILLPYQPAYIMLFGSEARGEARPDSDLDLLVKFSMRISYFDLSDMKDALEAELERHVDLATEKMLLPFIKENVMQDARPIYVA